MEVESTSQLFTDFFQDTKRPEARPAQWLPKPGCTSVSSGELLKNANALGTLLSDSYSIQLDRGPGTSIFNASQMSN